MQIKQKPTNKTRQTKNNKGDGFSCKKKPLRGGNRLFWVS